MTKTVLVLIGLLANAFADYYTLDFREFTIEVDKKWRYIEQQGIDSFVGEIRGPKVRLSFDCSDMGYASSLVLAPEDFLSREISVKYSHLFNKPGVIYTNGNVSALKKEEMTKRGITDSTAVSVEPFIRPKIRTRLADASDRVKFKDADYVVDLTHQDSTITVGIALPEEIRKHNVSIDTIAGFRIKTIWPKKVGNGITGVYYKKIGGRFSLQINGRNLGAAQQAAALKAFKTIKIKAEQ